MVLVDEPAEEIPWVEDLVEALGIASLSRSEVSRICSALDAEVETFRSWPWEDGYARPADPIRFATLAGELTAFRRPGGHGRAGLPPPKRSPRSTHQLAWSMRSGVR